VLNGGALVAEVVTWRLMQAQNIFNPLKHGWNSNTDSIDMEGTEDDQQDGVQTMIEDATAAPGQRRVTEFFTSS
jgi:hypothetical protein